MSNSNPHFIEEKAFFKTGGNAKAMAPNATNLMF